MKIEVINNPCEFNLDDLMTIGKRSNNDKRNFLFISKLLGKHIPINPDIIMATGYILAYEMLENKCHTIYQKKMFTECIEFIKNEDFRNTYVENNNCSLSQRLINIEKFDMKDTLFIGFAETATGISMATSFFMKNAYYVSTTREDLFDENILFSFEEEHSHATTHQCYCNETDVLNNIKSIVLIDDELTTGKTMKNLIFQLNDLTNISEYKILTVLDWRNSAFVNMLDFFAKENNLNIEVISLLSGNIENDDLNIYKDIEKPQELDRSVEFDNVYCYQEFNSLNASDNNVYQFTKQSGRILIPTKDLLSVEAMSYLVAYNFYSDLKEENPNIKNILVLGHGENIYIPSRIASYLNNNDDLNVEFKTTTRSPIYQDNEIIKSKHTFVDKSKNLYYFYNKEEIESKYDLVLFISETNGDSDNIEVPKLTNNFKVLKIMKSNLF